MEFGPIIDYINKHDRFIITAHETPDGDALGSEYALFLALRKLGKKVKIFNSDPAPKKFSFIKTDAKAVVLKDPQQIPADIDQYVLIVLDVSDLNNIGRIAELILPRVSSFFIIDHHEIDNDTHRHNLIQKSASSTAEILYLLFQEMKIEVDLEMAQSLYMAIIFDTGSFIYPKTTAITFEIARDLVARGANPNLIYSNVYESNSISSLLLLSSVLATLELELDKHVAIQTMTKEIIIAANSKYEEADQIINIPLKSREIRVSIFFKENSNGIRRCSMRSKGNINVAEIAQSYGGGGHKTAAGFKCKYSFEQTKIEILKKLKNYFPKAKL